MTHELRLERLFDAPPEVVFAAFVDPDAQQELFADPPGRGWTVLKSEIDLRVGRHVDHGHRETRRRAVPLDVRVHRDRPAAPPRRHVSM
jgi:uncharacterized protein YndB with AHSA1/START domain